MLLAEKLQKMEWLASRTTRSTKKTPLTLNRKEKVKEVQKPRHCLGPGCVNPAKNLSKYCSHECGIQLQIRYVVSISYIIVCMYLVSHKTFFPYNIFVLSKYSNKLLLFFFLKKHLKIAKFYPLKIH